MSNMLIALVLFFCVIVVIGFIAKDKECDAKGGVLVRGLYGYECIQRKPT